MTTDPTTVLSTTVADLLDGLAGSLAPGGDTKLLRDTIKLARDMRELPLELAKAEAAEQARVAALPPITPEQQARIDARMAERRRNMRAGR